MEENKTTNIQETTNSTPVMPVVDNQKRSKNIFMLLILLGLFTAFALLIYAATMNKEADYVFDLRPVNVLNPSKPVDTSSTNAQAKDVDSVVVGDVDTDLKDLDTDLQGL